jgi:short subunit dehydrogenase-like uncharacterized protein
VNSKRFLIYGANGYTGELVARRAVERGHRPLLGGRGDAVNELARNLGLEARVFSLDDGAAGEAALRDVGAVVHCAGPFSRTSRPMVDACLRTGTHYLDITGEVAVFETLAARDAEAGAAGILLLPGVGFDVVPSDCLAAHLKARLPSARRLALAFAPFGGVSRGTATTMIENIHRGGLVRRGGVLTPVPAGWKTREIDFGRGPRKAVTIPWGDVSTAFHSTGIPDIEVYMAAPRTLRWGLRLARPFLPWLATAPIQSYLKRRVRSGPPGPTAEERARGFCLLWGEADDDQGQRVLSRMRTPEGYTFTARAAVASVESALHGATPVGFQTPSRAFGKDFAVTIEGVTREDL